MSYAVCCDRCGKFERVGPVLQFEDKSYGKKSTLPPNWTIRTEWQDGLQGVEMTNMCPECTAAYEKFMGKGAVAQHG